MDSAGAEPLFFVLCHRDHGGGGGGDLDRTQKSSQYCTTYLQATLVSTIYYFSLPLFEHCVESVPGSRWTWAQKAGRLNRSLDHGPNPPLFGLLPSSEDRPPAPVAATHYQNAMCVTAWSNSPNKASIGTVSRGVWFVTLAWLLDHGPNGPFFRLLPPSDKPPHHH